MSDNGHGYIYIPNWDAFQHYKDRRPSWIKSYVELLDHDEYANLTFSQRGLLHGLWLLVARVGNGRVLSTHKTLSSALLVTNKGESRHLLDNLERLVRAGFIELRASKALAPRYQPASAELEGSKEPKRKNAREDSAENGAPARSEEELRAEIDEMARIADLAGFHPPEGFHP